MPIAEYYDKNGAEVVPSYTRPFPAAGDYYSFINQGLITGQTMIHKFGFSSTINTDVHDIWNAPSAGDLIPQTVAAKYDIVSTSTSDTIAGTGARTLVLEGLDSDFKEISEIIELSGQTPKQSENTYIRLNRSFIDDVGTYGGSNAGLITIRVTGAGDPQGYIEATEAQTQKSHYTVPAGKTAYIIRISETMETGKTVTINLRARTMADIIVAPFKASRIRHQWDGLDTPVGERLFANHIFPEKTDIWFTAFVSTGTAIVESDYDILLVDNQ